MPERPPFYPAQARELAEAFNAHAVDYMFIERRLACLEFATLASAEKQAKLDCLTG
jgi:hypothetical protein